MAKDIDDLIKQKLEEVNALKELSEKQKFDKVQEEIKNLKKVKEPKKIIKNVSNKELPPPPNNLPEPKDSLTETTYKIAKRYPKYYWLAFLVLFLASGLLFVVYYGYHSLLLTIIFAFFCFPFIGLSILFLLVRFFGFEFKKVKKVIVKKLSHNFVILTIFKAGKRQRDIIAMINPDGKTVSDGKKDYTIDNRGIWTDEEGYPHSYHIDNLPNNLIFGFETDLEKYVKTLNEMKSVPDFQGHLIDVSYSSENLQLLKKDKIFAELHKNPEMEKLVMLVLGLCFVLIIVFGLIIILKK